MGTERPLVTIAMAVYRPCPDWLRQQLLSLNCQTYCHLELLICDDCPEFPVDPAIFRDCITAFPWCLVVNEKNLGSNGTFERLTDMANGQYIAYCDQDDVWVDNKLELLVGRLENEDAQLCCSDLSIIDETGYVTAASITRIRGHHQFKEGPGLAPELIARNFVTGCAMIIRADTAKAAIPFEKLYGT